jgi:hypothetical protein
MNNFTASNGIGVRLDGRDLDIKNTTGWFGLCGDHVVDALREFFRAEEDERLGRWRWPENPEYVVYPKGDGVVLAASEASGHCVEAVRAQANHTQTGLHRAARAYFDAHPEPKPWHDAKPGELWALTIDGQETPGFTYASQTFEGGVAVQLAEDRGGFGITGSAITAGHKIWPVE